MDLCFENLTKAPCKDEDCKNIKDRMPIAVALLCGLLHFESANIKSCTHTRAEFQDVSVDQKGTSLIMSLMCFILGLLRLMLYRGCLLAAHVSIRKLIGRRDRVCIDLS